MASSRPAMALNRLTTASHDDAMALGRETKTLTGEAIALRRAALALHDHPMPASGDARASP
jgi:hypothetical protein